nr:methyl-CpG-binding domain-containing protein 9-like [Tanacetum cinerariifolium]
MEAWSVTYDDDQETIDITGMSFKKVRAEHSQQPKTVEKKENKTTGVQTLSDDLDDAGVLGYPTMVSRRLDFRTVDLRLAAGFYVSHESFIDDVHETLVMPSVSDMEETKEADRESEICRIGC